MQDLLYPARLVSVALLAFSISGCKPDPVEPDPPPTPATTGVLKVRIIPTWEGGSFALNASYVNVSNYRVKVEALKFYWGEVNLVNSAGSTLVKDVDLFDMEGGVAEVEWTVAPGTWSGIHAGLGVPQTMNEADPIVYPPGHPLDLAKGTYWSWAMGYRFLLFDGRFDLDGSGTGDILDLFSMHTGMNECYAEFDLPFDQDFSVTAGNTTTITINMAVDRLFYSATDTLDLATENQTHGTNLPLALELTNNAVHSFSAQ